MSRTPPEWSGVARELEPEEVEPLEQIADRLLVSPGPARRGFHSRLRDRFAAQTPSPMWQPRNPVGVAVSLAALGLVLIGLASLGLAGVGPLS